MVVVDVPVAVVVVVVVLTVVVVVVTSVVVVVVVALVVVSMAVVLVVVSVVVAVVVVSAVVAVVVVSVLNVVVLVDVWVAMVVITCVPPHATKVPGIAQISCDQAVFGIETGQFIASLHTPPPSTVKLYTGYPPPAASVSQAAREEPKSW